MRMPVPSRRHLIITAWIVGLVVVILLAYLLVVVGRLSDEDREGDVDRAALRRAFDEANSRLADAGEEPVEVPDGVTTDAEVDDPDLNDPDLNDPDPNDPDPNDPDPNDPERQNAEVDNGDPNDAEVQDGEVQDAEVDDPDPDDPENQDPEQDDPDPNSALNFAVSDSCSPPSGEFVTSVDLTVQRDEGTVTYVLTCTSGVIPFPGNSPGNQ
jgi:hypothetical protein